MTSPIAVRHRASELRGPDLPGPPPTRLLQDYHRLDSPTFLCPRIACLHEVGRFNLLVPINQDIRDIPLATSFQHGRALGGTGISTGYTSTTPIGLALAPDLPWED